MASTAQHVGGAVGLALLVAVANAGATGIGGLRGGRAVGGDRGRRSAARGPRQAV
ncbi:hypothetical protein ABT324_17690 [Saccharopolyspora sp. NPDC000359]|uniref:hypothetical protein n=1 Tax=Saccharopolyspora sp. NPDC000359 TaxID=3154251 RepID=UPI003329F66F